MGYLSKIERYNFDNMFFETKDNAGLIICYAIAMLSDLELSLVELEAEFGDIGTPQAWYHKYYKKGFTDTFPNIEQFLLGFDYDDFGLWTVEFIYNGVNVAISEKRAVLTIKKLLQHQDIYAEFVTSLTSEKYPDKNNAIIVEGYNAETLEKSYPLSMLGAYNYLIYLRNLPEEALENLKNGLPRK